MSVISRLIDSPDVVRINLSSAMATVTGVDQVIVAGRLAEIDDPEAMRHDGAVTFWADEALALYRRFDRVPPAVIQVRATMGGSVDVDRSDLEDVFGRGSRSRRDIDALWKTWGRLERRSWIARRTWAQRRLVEAGVDAEEARMWSANYATDRLEVDASDPF